MDSPSTHVSLDRSGSCRPHLLTHTLLPQVDSLKGLLHSPSVLVCAGHEAFRPLAVEDVRRNGSEPLSGQTSRRKSGEFVPQDPQPYLHWMVVW